MRRKLLPAVLAVTAALLAGNGFLNAGGERVPEKEVRDDIDTRRLEQSGKGEVDINIRDWHRKGVTFQQTCESAFASYQTFHRLYAERAEICTQARDAMNRENDFRTCLNEIGQISDAIWEETSNRSHTFVFESRDEVTGLRNAAADEYERLRDECTRRDGPPLADEHLDRAYGVAWGTSLALEEIQRRRFRAEAEVCRSCNNVWPEEEFGGLETRHCSQ